ncbi:MAG: carboxypeptidase regulatory-like domain-containing protein [Sulfurovum sp.]|nr:carboxypeptidase regulatory-like domain-containing protein [Sulfurovum sp.]
MNKSFFTSTLSIVLLLLLSGCVSSKRITYPLGLGTQTSNINDVDMSDLDENLSESEMMLTENGGIEKIQRMPFPIAEYSSLPKIGKGTITGTIYLRDSYGQPVVGASTRLYLNPITSYSQEWYEVSYLAGKKMAKADTRLFNYLKFTASDRQGKFNFYGVPNGSYYLIGTVKCAQRCGFSATKSIRITSKVSVYGNQIVQQNLTRDMQ